MTWSIPTKTFLLGEYAALAGYSAIILTSTPCFKLRLSHQTGLHGIHPESPAGKLWARYPRLSHYGLHWEDPYQGLGGLGASSAQFIGVYRANAYLEGQPLDKDALLTVYQDITFDPKGIPPSGYDVLAQSAEQTDNTARCVYLNQRTNTYLSYPWPFADIGYILVHTRKKLATHQHLQSLHALKDVEELGQIVDRAQTACDAQESKGFVQAIQDYHQALTKRAWVATHTLTYIQQLQSENDMLALKGCGALGADVILLLVDNSNMANTLQHLSAAGWGIIATNGD